MLHYEDSLGTFCAFQNVSTVKKKSLAQTSSACIYYLRVAVSSELKKLSYMGVRDFVE